MLERTVRTRCAVSTMPGNQTSQPATEHQNQHRGRDELRNGHGREMEVGVVAGDAPATQAVSGDQSTVMRFQRMVKFSTASRFLTRAVVATLKVA